jgi:hypothetical protein
MDRMTSGILLLLFGVVLLLWWYRTERSARELTFRRLTEGAI